MEMGKSYLDKTDNPTTKLYSEMSTRNPLGIRVIKDKFILDKKDNTFTIQIDFYLIRKEQSGIPSIYLFRRKEKNFVFNVFIVESQIKQAPSEDITKTKQTLISIGSID